MSLSFMEPTEFVGRCVYATSQFFGDEVNISKNSPQLAGVQLNGLGPLDFDSGPFTFQLSVLQMDEVAITRATIVNEAKQIARASMIVSRINGSVMAHWLDEEIPDDDMVLFTIMTKDEISVSMTGNNAVLTAQV